MKKNPIYAAMLIAGLSFSSLSFAASDDLPNIKILATGGTIAGTGESAAASAYTVAEVAVGELIAAVPDMLDVANISGEQVVEIGSQDMNDEVWLTLAQRVNELLAQDNVDGIVITHGTDTMGETAYFLDLTVSSDKPVVLVGALRPSTAMSADGPMNLYNAVVTAAHEDSKNRGVLVAMNNTVFDARDVTKTNTTAVDTFQSPNSGALGYIYNADVQYHQSIPGREHATGPAFDVSELETLPKVGIVYNYANASVLPVTAMVDANYNGIVSAGVGNGNMYHAVFDELAQASQDGVLVVRSSRTLTGPTTLDAEVDDAKYGFVGSGTLNPQKARILLMLSLTQTNDYTAVQELFLNY